MIAVAPLKRINKALRQIVSIAALAALFLSSPSGSRAEMYSAGLTALHKSTAASYPRVDHVTTEQLLNLRTDLGDKLLLLDVREPAEYQVSHISSSQQIPPEITTSDFAKRFRPITQGHAPLQGQSRLQGRTIILYCSVGLRSTKLAARIATLQKELGIVAIYNLKGGIFNWHNQRLPLSDATSRTDLVHPYSSFWSYLISRRKMISYYPANQSSLSN